MPVITNGNLIFGTSSRPAPGRGWGRFPDGFGSRVDRCHRVISPCLAVEVGWRTRWFSSGFVVWSGPDGGRGPAEAHERNERVRPDPRRRGPPGRPRRRRGARAGSRGSARRRGAGAGTPARHAGARSGACRRRDVDAGDERQRQRQREGRGLGGVGRADRSRDGIAEAGEAERADRRRSTRAPRARRGRRARRRRCADRDHDRRDRQRDHQRRERAAGDDRRRGGRASPGGA